MAQKRCNRKLSNIPVEVTSRQTHVIPRRTGTIKVLCDQGVMQRANQKRTFLRQLLYFE
jgi:hypothetical protein